MNEKINILKSEVWKNLRSISILILVTYILYKGWPLTKVVKENINEELAWSLDFAIYSALLSIVYSLIQYLFSSNKLNIFTEILNNKENINKITLKNGKKDEVELKIHIKGKRRWIPSKMKVIFPDWIDIQVKPELYLKET